jgi:UDP-GlcNAc:undecaprenyl-phosphate GlcNAc-1-phosphate transferase
MVVLFSFLLAMAVTMVLIPPLMQTAVRLRFVDFPDPRKQHPAPIPCIGGFAMVIGAVIPIAMWLLEVREVGPYLAAAACIVLLGMADDRLRLGYRVKFAGQLVAVAIVVLIGGVVVNRFPLLGAAELPAAIAIPFTMFALLGVTNAMNLADGLDGLAGGTSLLSLGGIALLAFLTDDAVLLLITLAVMGSVVGFLRFNTYPARVFMGDGGSQFLGFSTGVLTIMLVQRSEPEVSPAIALMLLGLPVFDTLLVIYERLRDGRSPFVADRNHLHHKLLARGFTHYEAVVIIYLIQAALVSGAYFLRASPDALILGVYLAVCAALVAFLNGRLFAGWRPARGDGSATVDAPPGTAVDYRLGRHAREAAEFALALYLLAGVLGAAAVPFDLALLAAGLLAALAVGFAFKGYRHQALVERGGLYLACSLVVYLCEVHPPGVELIRMTATAVLIALAVAVIVAVKYGERGRFEATPLDFLVVFVAIVIPNLHHMQFQANWISAASIKIIVLFYAVEVALADRGTRTAALRSTAALSVGIAAARGLLGG